MQCRYFVRPLCAEEAFHRALTLEDRGFCFAKAVSA